MYYIFHILPYQIEYRTAEFNPDHAYIYIS